VAIASLTLCHFIRHNNILAIYSARIRFRTNKCLENFELSKDNWKLLGYLYGTCEANFMAYAIIETGGKQLRVEPGRFYDIERLAVDEDASVTIDKVLFIDHDGESFVGQPWVEGATVEGTVLRHLRGRKIIVYKMRPKKKTRKKQGHRQELTRLMINSISLGGSTTGDVAAEAAAPAPVTEAPAVADAEVEASVS
jgi:large subunit ribosomal protein L21